MFRHSNNTGAHCSKQALKQNTHGMTATESTQSYITLDTSGGSLQIRLALNNEFWEKQIVLHMCAGLIWSVEGLNRTQGRLPKQEGPTSLEYSRHLHWSVACHHLDYFIFEVFIITLAKSFRFLLNMLIYILHVLFLWWTLTQQICNYQSYKLTVPQRNYVEAQIQWHQQLLRQNIRQKPNVKSETSNRIW